MYANARFQDSPRWEGACDPVSESSASPRHLNRPAGDFFMTARGGWFSVDRDALDSWLWQLKPPQFKLAITCLGAANYKDGSAIWEAGTIRIPRGSFVTSLQNLADLAGVSLQNTKTGLRQLQDFGFLTQEVTRRYRLITIVKYETYQGERDRSNTNPNREVTASQPRANTNRTKNKEQRKNVSPPEAYELADLLRSKIADRLPDNRDVRPPRWQRIRDNWALILDRAHRLDGRTWEHLRRAIEWSQSDPFWSTNILSAKKLRDKFDAMAAQARKAKVSAEAELEKLRDLS